jgi:hypothetical protein
LTPCGLDEAGLLGLLEPVDQPQLRPQAVVLSLLSFLHRDTPCMRAALAGKPG